MMKRLSMVAASWSIIQIDPVEMLVLIALIVGTALVLVAILAAMAWAVLFHD